MYKNSLDSGYDAKDNKRFEVLKSISFSSILDVGSGPCRLNDWLVSIGYDGIYEAMDIRTEVLEHCKCKTYNKITGRKKYDLVCLFGVSDYCKNDEKYKKEEFKNLLIDSAKKSRKFVVFSLVKDSIKANNLVRYSIEEIKDLSILSNLEIFDIDSESEPTEYVVKCNIKMVNNEAKEKQSNKKINTESKSKKKNNDSNSIA